jgi:multiple sugar transport system permease protein
MTLRRAVLWMAPALALLLALSIYPTIFSIKVSLTDATGGFTLQHFGRLFNDRLFGIALGQTALYTAAALSIELMLGLGLALLVDSLGRGRGLIRAGLLAPMLLPPVVAAVIWRLVYNLQFGVLNTTLRATGIDTSRLTWTSGESTALWSVVVVDVWEWTPFMFLLLSAGLQSLPHEPFEAALIDGASAWRIFWDLTLPLLKPTITVAILLRAMDLLRIFDQIWILTQGGPGYATETVSLYIYRTAFRFFNFGYAAAMSFALLFLTTVFSRSVLRLMHQGVRR